MYFSPPGLALGIAFAQRNNLSRSAAASVGIVGGMAGNTPLGLVLALALAQRSQPQQPVSVAVGGGGPAVPAVQQVQIATTDSITATARDRGGIYVVEIEWAPVVNATQYLVNCYHRNRATAKWEMREAVTVLNHRPLQNVLPPAATETTVRSNYGYSVTALNGINNVGDESTIVQVTLI